MNQRQQQNLKIRRLISQNPQGLTRGEISGLLDFPIEGKTLQRRLRKLVEGGEIRRRGDRRATRYFPREGRLTVSVGTDKASDKDVKRSLFSISSVDALKYLDTPVFSRPSKSYNRSLLEDYVPNKTRYVPINLSQEMGSQGQIVNTALAAGTYARHICERLLIDLSFNSSRLEGNTYSELETKRLVEEGISAEGKAREDTVMIINHKEAMLFLIENAPEIDASIFIICNLHYLLAQDLLANPEACGRVRTLSVEIDKSSYKPLNSPHQLKEYFELALLKARKIADPFEQSFFLLLHLSYLQVFEDVNKRTARLACNIPFIKNNLCPLSFSEVPREDYLSALLMVYEANNLSPMLELFHWAYLRSCERYDDIKQSLGEIDPFRIQHRQQRKEVMGEVIRAGLQGGDMQHHIEAYCVKQRIENADKFTAMTLTDLSNLHEGAIVGLGISYMQFQKWQQKQEA